MRLTDCFMELIAYVAYMMKTVDAKQPPFDQVKTDIQRMVSESERCVEKEGFSREEYDLARFAVCAWIDETILSSPWNERNRWQGEQLQLVYYKTTDAGELFFDRLNAIGPHQREVREVYYLCLALGFQGQYCNEGDDFLLDQVKTSNLKLLTGSSVGIPSLERGELFPEAYVDDASQLEQRSSGRSRFSWFSLAFILFPILLFGGLFFIYRFILDNVGDSLLKTVA
ncbi:MAG: type IVB secretion system protein IcmH/DotU [Thermodesulfobacteriota bacterium]